MLTFRQDSRLLAAKLHVVDGQREWGLRKALELLDGDQCTVYECKDGDTLPGIAFQAYQNEYLWWIIADVNDLLEPWNITMGQKLKVPAKATIMALWERQRCAS